MLSDLLFQFLFHIVYPRLSLQFSCLLSLIVHLFVFLFFFLQDFLPSSSHSFFFSLIVDFEFPKNSFQLPLFMPFLYHPIILVSWIHCLIFHRILQCFWKKNCFWFFFLSELHLLVQSLVFHIGVFPFFPYFRVRQCKLMGNAISMGSSRTV